MHSSCTGTDFRLLQVAFLITDGLILTTCVPILYHFIKSRKQLKSKKMLLFGVYIFVLFDISFLVTHFCVMLMGCEREPFARDPISIVLLGTYFLQTYGVVFVAYYRLVFVFKGSVFAISKCTTKMYKIVLLTIPLLYAIGILLGKDGDLLLGLSVFLVVGSLLITMILFVRKLKNAYQTDIQPGNKEFIRVITKVTILNATSITSTFCVPFILVLIILFVPDYAEGGQYVLTFALILFSMIADAYINLLCVMLSFPSFKGYYEKLCGFLDTKCKLLCNKITGQDEINLATVASDSNLSGITESPSITVTKNVPTKNVPTKMDITE